MSQILYVVRFHAHTLSESVPVMKYTVITVLQIRRGNRINLGMTVHIFSIKTCSVTIPTMILMTGYDPSLEPSHPDRSNEGSLDSFS